MPLLDVFDPQRAARRRVPARAAAAAADRLTTGTWSRRSATRTRRASRPRSSACGAWLEGLAERTGVPIERTVLGGFSQGAVMAWALALGPGRPRPAGILAMSGFIPTVPDFELQLDGLGGLPGRDHPRRRRPGRSRSSSAARRATARRPRGADVAYRETDVPHIVDPRADPAAWSTGSTSASPSGRSEHDVAARREALARRHLPLARLGVAGGAGDALRGALSSWVMISIVVQPELAERPVGGEPDRAGGDPAAARVRPRPSSRSRRCPRPGGCPGPRCWRARRRPRRPRASSSPSRPSSSSSTPAIQPSASARV